MAVTDISTGLPDLSPSPLWTYTVDTGQNLAIITKLNVVGVSLATGQRIELELLPPLLVFEDVA